MPWISEEFSHVIKEGRALVETEFGVRPTAIVFFCTEEEIFQETRRELTSRSISSERLKFLEKKVFPQIIGKFFPEKKEIWLVDGKGTTVSTLVHELIHSIQKCAPHRENIVDFITYRILKGSEKPSIEPELLGEWTEIESQYGFARIKQNILRKGDCEDF